MPVMPRISSRARKIAYSILGTPPNLRKDRNGNKVNKRLQFEESSLVKQSFVFPEGIVVDPLRVLKENHGNRIRNDARIVLLPA